MINFSIIIPTRNRPQMLKRCLEALNEQIKVQDKSFIIVIDDNSNSQAKSHNRTYCELFNVTYIANSSKLGPATSRNIGIKKSTGVWVVFLDDDVIIDHDWYRNLTKAIKNTRPSDIGIEGKVNASGNGLWDKEVQNLNGGLYLSCHILYKRSELISQNGFDQTFHGPFCEDHELAARILKKGSIVFYPFLSVTHQPRNVNLLKQFLSTPSRITTLIQSEFHFYNKHPDYYHKFRRHSTFTGTLCSLSLRNIISEFRRRTIGQYIHNPFQTAALFIIALTEQVIFLINCVVYISEIIKKKELFFLNYINQSATKNVWSLPAFDYKLFTLKRSLLNLFWFKISHRPVYNALTTHKLLNSKSKRSTCQMYLRIDDIFLNEPETVEQFAKLIRKYSVTILAGILGNDIIDPVKWPLIELLSECGAFIAVHGFNHQGTFGPFDSELLQMRTQTFLNKIDPVLQNLKKLKQPCYALIPPFNAIGRDQIIEWSKTFKIICGGPETARFTDRLYGPLALISGGWYFPSISPFYSNAEEMIKNRIPDLLPTIKGPVCFTTHFTHESKDNFKLFSHILQATSQYTHSWSEIAQW